MGLGKTLARAFVGLTLSSAAHDIDPQPEPQKNMECPYCKGDKFIEGPSGGMSTNVLCANEECRHWFNYTPGLPLDDLHRTEPTEDEQKRIQRKAAEERADWNALMMDHGAAIYRKGVGPMECLTTPDDMRVRPGRTADNCVLWWRPEVVTAGFLAAMQEDVIALRNASAEQPEKSGLDRLYENTHN